MTPTGWPPTAAPWTLRALVAVNDDLHAWQRAVTAMREVAGRPLPATPGSLAAPLQQAADAAVSVHDHPSLIARLAAGGHADLADRYNQLWPTPNPHLTRLRDMARLDSQHLLDHTRVASTLLDAATVLERTGRDLAELEHDLLHAAALPTCCHPPPGSATTPPDRTKEATTTT